MPKILIAMTLALMLATLAWGQVTLINWDFEDSAKRDAITNDATFQSSPYTADAGIIGNVDIKSIGTVGRPTFTAWFTGAPPTGAFAPTATNWGSGSGTKYWQISLVTTGYSGLTLSSKQRGSSTSPKDFKLQYSLNESVWTDVSGGSIVIAENWTSGVLESISLPSACDNQAIVYLRWIMTSNTSVSGATVANTGTNRIDDILVTGTAGTVPAINVTGSLSPFSTFPGTPSASQSYTLAGANLSSSITISIPAGFELSTNGGINYYTGTTSVASSFSGTVLVRLTGATAGTYSGNIVHSSMGASSVSQAVSGMVSSGTVSAPTLQAANIAGYPGYTSITLEWTPGNGSARVVKINTSNSFTAPANGSSPAANTVYAGAGQQVIYNGATEIIEGETFDSCTVTNLTPNTTYWFRIYEYNGSGAEILYLTTSATNNPRSVITTSSSGTGYYSGIYGNGTTLKGLLHSLIKTTHTTQYSYEALKTQIPYTDEDPLNSNNLIEIYTGNSIPKADFGAGTTDWNREHTWSKSHGDFGDVAPAGTDLHHLRPCDATVNSTKSNKDFDNGGTPVTDNSPPSGYTGVTGCYQTDFSWEPRPADKGDVARMIMYMAVRYEGDDSYLSVDLELRDYVYTDAGTNQPYYGKLATLLQWHAADPPDAWELRRNNRIAERQGNRNPFIDMPGYAARIWTPCPISSTNITTTGFTGNWSTPITATDYYLQVASDSLFTSVVNGYENLDINLMTSYPVSGLSPGGTYYYRLRSYFVDDYSMYSPYLAVTLSQPVVATAILTPAQALEEINLSGATLTLSLQNTTFSDSALLLSNFSLNNAPAGLSIVNVSYMNSTTATLTLAFNGTDFDNNYPAFSLTILDAEIAATSNLTTATLSITAHVEGLASIAIDGSQVRLTITPLTGAVSYRVFASGDPYGTYSEISSSGSFDPTHINIWRIGAASAERRFFRVSAIRG